jgi:CHAT domain-containing protein
MKTENGRLKNKRHRDICLSRWRTGMDYFHKRRVANRPNMLKAALATLLITLWTPWPESWGKDLHARETQVSRPEQMTAQTDPVRDMAVSGDGRWLIYALGSRTGTNLRLKSLTAAQPMGSKQLTDTPFDESAPAFSADNRLIAYVGRTHDIKGDIYLLDLAKDSAKSLRLTGRDTEDGAPCFAPRGSVLFFHQSNTDRAFKHLIALDLNDPQRRKTLLDTRGDGANPAVSPDGNRLAFVSYRQDPAGDIFLLDLKTNRVSPLTRGPFRDDHPVWSYQGDRIYFERQAMDTNRNGRIDHRDNFAIFSIAADHPETSPERPPSMAFPLTPATYSAKRPVVSRSKLYFIAERGGADNCWALPLSGVIPHQDNALAQARLAEYTARRFPYDPYHTLLAHYKVLELFSENADHSAKAAYEIGCIYQALGDMDAAGRGFAVVTGAYGTVLPYGPMARIHQIVIDTHQRIAAADSSVRRQEILQLGLEKLKAISKSGFSDKKNPEFQPIFRIRAKALIAAAGLLYEKGNKPASLTAAVTLLNEVINLYPFQGDLAAEAMVLKADIYGHIGSPDKAYLAYLAVVTAYPDEEEWTGQAIQRILDIAISGLKTERLADKIEALQDIAAKNTKQHPILAIGALNRMADLYFAADQWDKAKNTYRQVLDAFEPAGVQTAAARLALAEILYKEERFREALDLYQTEIGARPTDDHLYHLARAGYIRKSVAAGEFQYRLNEISSAQNRFKALLEYDDAIIEAHRGYIKCAAALDDILRVLTIYEARLAQSPDEPLVLYTVALCLTYLKDHQSIKRAETLLLQAIEKNGGEAYFHQTLGYVQEVMETAYGETGRLESALASYRRAYFLTDAKDTPDNAADLALNMGNICFLLGRFEKALEYYTLRLESKKPFDHGNAQILFYKRLGAAAFQARGGKKTIDAFSRALDLIEARVDPRAASDAFDRINRYIIDKVVSPARKRPDLISAADALAKIQSVLYRRLTALTLAAKPPPSFAWKTYRQEMENLLARQIRVYPRVIGLQERAKNLNPNPEQIKKHLTTLSSAVSENLSVPERLIELKAEMLDRLGLAYQETGNWKKAAEYFERTFALNQQLGNHDNLSRNKRAAAFCKYHIAETLSGDARRRHLEATAQDFAEVIRLVQEYGVPAPENRSKAPQLPSALIDISARVSLDAADTTAAAHGFSSDQEIRLAQAFLHRIHLELGFLIPAETALKQQLAQYPTDKPLLASDKYGVALLYHRAGHLAYTRDDLPASFENFHFAAGLALELKNPVSAAINTANMAHVLQQITSQTKRLNDYRTWLEIADQKTQALLAPGQSQAPTRVAGAFHNKMGVFYAAWPKTQDQTLLQQVSGFRWLHQAGFHFARGIYLLEREKTGLDREGLALLCTLHLNMGAVANDFGEAESALKHFGAARDLAQHGRLPDLLWRADAGLGRLDEAFQALGNVNLFRAGCAPEEITNTFGRRVYDLVAAGKTEAAFNVAERLSELERFHRLTPFTGLVPYKPLYAQVYPILIRMHTLNKKLSLAPDEEKYFLKEQLSNEIVLLQSYIGTNRENLPDILKNSPQGSAFEQALLLLGTAAYAEAAAQELKPAVANAGSEYEMLTTAYDRLRQESLESRPSDTAADILTFLGPQPCEAIDVMENLPGGFTLIRLFQVPKLKKIIVFRLTSDNIQVSLIDTLAQLTLPAKGGYYLAYENPAQLPIPMRAACALSATHFMRSVRNRKPFKRTLLTLGPLAPSNQHYDLRMATAFKDMVQPELLQGAHTLVIGQKVGPITTVPVRSGKTPEKHLALETDAGQRIALESVFGIAPDLSLALLPAAMAKDAYLLGHMTALLGCPSLLLPDRRVENQNFLTAFLKSYPSNSAIAALEQSTQVRKPSSDADRWILLGNQGMTPEESAEFAARHFIQYVKQGQAAFQAGNPHRALSMFENGIRTAKEIDDFRQYLAKLYQYAREAAYQADLIDKAQTYAAKLLELVSATQPDSQAHAEALLRLGLIHGRQGTYSQAVPLLMEAVEIMTALEAGPPLAAALQDLGIVLENASQYDQALVRFQSAADLSRSLHKNDLLAAQYMNIGRIYDLRLSQYALALQHYQKAYDLYQEAGQPSAVAQSLIDMARCHRLLGDFSQAERHLIQALAALNQWTSAPEQAYGALKAKIFIEQANNAWFQAGYQRAFKLQQAAHELAQKHDLPLLQIISHNTAGLIWWSLGDQTKALHELNQALEKARMLNTREDEIATTLNNIGLVYRETEHYEDALSAFDAALAIDYKLKSRWAIAYDLRNKGLTLLRMNRASEAIPLFVQAAEDAQAIGNRINQAKALLGLGQARAAVGSTMAAGEAFEAARKLSASMFIRETWWRALFELARLNLFQHPDKAEMLLHQAVSVIEGMRSEIKIEQLKDNFIVDKLAVYETLVKLLADQGRISDAFEVAERSRARNFIDLLGSRQPEFRRASDRKLFERERKIRARIEAQEALVANSTDFKAREIYQKTLTNLNHDMSTTRIQIQAENPRMAALMTIEPLTTDHLYPLMEPGLSFLSYYVLADEILCWHIDQNRIQLTRTPISKKNLSQAIFDYRRSIQNLEPVDNLAKELFDLLLAPVLPFLTHTKTLGIIPHGPLHYLSFATLSVGDAYLIDRFSLFYLPSASTYGVTVHRRTDTKTMKVLTIGNPDLGDPALDLPFSEYEVGSIQWNFKNITTLTRRAATKKRVAEDMEKFDIVHLASHGEFDAVHPLFSAIKLAKGDAGDGDLKALEVLGLAIDADLVVLSACQTGLGQITDGDDVIGLNRSFLYAGAHTLISSLWRVSDLSTAILIKQFYRRYTANNKADSLRLAILHVKNRYPHPGYWGAFTLVGDYL